MPPGPGPFPIRRALPSVATSTQCVRIKSCRKQGGDRRKPGQAARRWELTRQLDNHPSAGARYRLRAGRGGDIAGATGEAGGNSGAGARHISLHPRLVLERFLLRDERQQWRDGLKPIKPIKPGALQRASPTDSYACVRACVLAQVRVRLPGLTSPNPTSPHFKPLHLVHTASLPSLRSCCRKNHDRWSALPQCCRAAVLPAQQVPQSRSGPCQQALPSPRPLPRSPSRAEPARKPAPWWWRWRRIGGVPACPARRPPARPASAWRATASARPAPARARLQQRGAGGASGRQ